MIGELSYKLHIVDFNEEKSPQLCNFDNMNEESSRK